MESHPRGWDCPRCTKTNPEGTECCAVCQETNPAVLQQIAAGDLREHKILAGRREHDNRLALEKNEEFIAQIQQAEQPRTLRDRRTAASPSQNDPPVGAASEAAAQEQSGGKATAKRKPDPSSAKEPAQPPAEKRQRPREAKPPARRQAARRSAKPASDRTRESNWELEDTRAGVLRTDVQLHLDEQLRELYLSRERGRDEYWEPEPPRGWQESVRAVIGAGCHPAICVRKCPEGHPLGSDHFGVYATEEIRAGALINEYTGEVCLNRAEAGDQAHSPAAPLEMSILKEQRAKLEEKWSMGLKFEGLDMLDNVSMVVKASLFRNEMALINDKKELADSHNCEYVTVVWDGWPRILVRATANIARGDELLADYGPEYWDELANAERANAEGIECQKAWEHQGMSKQLARLREGGMLTKDQYEEEIRKLGPVVLDN